MSTTSRNTNNDAPYRPRHSPLFRWRTIDLLTCAFIGVAFGVAYWAWYLLYQAPSTALGAVFPPLQGITEHRG